MVDWNAKYGAVDTLLYGEKPSDIINKAQPRLTILNHVLSLDGSSDDEILDTIKKNTDHDVLIAKDLMTIDIKDEIYIYKQKNL